MNFDKSAFSLKFFRSNKTIDQRKAECELKLERYRIKRDEVLQSMHDVSRQLNNSTLLPAVSSFSPYEWYRLFLSMELFFYTISIANCESSLNEINEFINKNNGVSMHEIDDSNVNNNSRA